MADQKDINITGIDPAQVDQTVTTPNLDLFNPKPNAWQIIGDVLGRRNRPISGILGGFMSDYGRRKAAKEEIPALEKIIQGQDKDILTPNTLKQIGAMSPENALQELSILQSKALQRKAAAKQFEPKQYWDKAANNGQGGIVSVPIDTSKPLPPNIVTLGQHARDEIAKAASHGGQPTPYKDLRDSIIQAGGTAADAERAWYQQQVGIAGQKTAAEAMAKPLGENSKNWINSRNENPDPNLTPHEAYQDGFHPGDAKQQENIRRLGSALGDATSMDVKNAVRQMLRDKPAATEGAAIWNTFMKSPARRRVDQYNADMLQMITPTFASTLRVNERELEILRSYMIKLPTVGSPSADTLQQAYEKIQKTQQQLQKLLKMRGQDPSMYIGDAKAMSPYDKWMDDSAKAKGDDILNKHGLGSE